MSVAATTSEEPLLVGAKRRACACGTGFKQFISKGNVVQLAVAFIIAGAFQAIVHSLVKDILLPPVGLAIGNSMDNIFSVIGPGKSKNATYSTIAQAAADGAVTENWGRFLQTIVYFLVVSLFLYIILYFASEAARVTQKLAAKYYGDRHHPVDTISAKTEKACEFCCKMIPVASTRCCFCTSFTSDAKQQQKQQQEAAGKMGGADFSVEVASDSHSEML